MKILPPASLPPLASSAAYSFEPHVRPVGTEDPAVLLERHNEEIIRIARHHGVARAWVFGSVARGESCPGSDLDLLIEPGPVLTPFFPGGLLVELEDLLGCGVDVATAQSLPPSIREEVLREARVLL